MKLLFECELPGRVGIKKNSKRLAQVRGRPMMFSSKQYLAWRRSALIHLKQIKTRRLLTISCPLMAEYSFHFKDRRSESDVSNCIEGPADLLQEASIIENDKQIVSLSARKVFDGTEKTVIKLYELAALDGGRRGVKREGE